MATAKEGGVAANNATSSYGGGGAGGKFKKKPFRKQTTPYDRPPTVLRVNSDNSSSWLRKLVVEPASKLISYGADRFFAPLLRKRLPQPPPPQPPETEADVSDGVQGEFCDLESQDDVQEIAGDDCSQQLNTSSSNVMSELEQLLKQRTFTRSEILHLRELLQSRAVELSKEDVAPQIVNTATDYASHQQFASGLLEENRNGGNRSVFMTTPIVNSKVIEDDNASPAELAKAYMGSRPPKVSPSVLGMRNRAGREDTGLLSSLPSASSSPIMALTKKAPDSMAAPGNGFITPRSRGRSAIYSMARTPYSKAHLTSSLKGTGINSNGYAGQSLSSHLSPVQSDEQSGSHPMRLKRRSSVFDDEFGSVGPIRRIRQKPNLLATRIHHTTNEVGVRSHANQKLLLIGESSHKVSKDVGENENQSVPTTSYSRIPSKSSEVASKILQHLERMTPKEKSPESKLVARREKSPLTLTPTMLSGQALRNMEDVDSSKLPLDSQDDHKLGDRSNATLADPCNFSTHKHEKDNGPKKSVAPLDKWNSVPNNDYVLSLKASTPSTGIIVKTSASQPPQKKRAFRMSAEEDYFEQDDDAHCNGLAPKPFLEKNGPMETSLTDNKVVPPEEPKLVKPSIQQAGKSLLAPISRKTSEAYSNAITLGIVSNGVSSTAPEETNAASQSAVFPLSVDARDKPKDTNNSTLFSFSSVPVRKVASLHSESTKEAELKIENSSSVFNVPSSTSPQVKIPESDRSYHLNKPFKAGDINGKSGSVPFAASNGPAPISSPPPLSFSAAAFNNANQLPKDRAPLLPSLNSSGTSVPTSTSAASSGGIFGLTTNTSSSTASNFKFGSPVEPATSVSAASTTSVLADKKTKLDPSFGGSSSSSLSNAAPFSSANSGSTTFGFGSSFSFSDPNNKLQGPSPFANASKPLVSGAGIGLEGTTTQSVISSASSSLPAFNINSSTSLGSTSSSQGFNSNSAFGFTQPASSSTISALIPGSRPAVSAVKFDSSSTEGTAFSSGSGASLAGAVGSSITSVFGFSANSSGSAPVSNTASYLTSLSGGSTAIFTFGGSSPSSSSSAPNSTSVFGSPALTSPSPSVFSFGALTSSSSPKLSTAVFGSPALTSPSPSTALVFGAPAASSSTPASVFHNPSSLGSAFSFTTASPSIVSSPSVSQPVFGNPARGFVAAASPDQMNAEDSMAEDNIVQTSAAAPPGLHIFGQQTGSSIPPGFGQPASSTPPVFGQPTSSTPPPAFGFGLSSVASQPNPFMFGGQQNQTVAPQNNPSPFQASGSFSLGSGGGDKSDRKIVRISRSKNRKK